MKLQRMNYVCSGCYSLQEDVLLRVGGKFMCPECGNVERVRDKKKELFFIDVFLTVLIVLDLSKGNIVVSLWCVVFLIPFNVVYVSTFFICVKKATTCGTFLITKTDPCFDPYLPEVTLDSDDVDCMLRDDREGDEM